MCDFDKIRKGAENTERRANGQRSRAITKHCWCLLIGQKYYFFFHVKNIVRASDWPRLVLQCFFSDYFRGFLSFLSSNEVQQSRVHKASFEEKE